MTSGDAKSLSALGFLTVVEHSQRGLFGGYLLLNFSGRPLEFHCTAPIKPNRAQEILYGPTLQPYLYGEQIGAALVAKASQPAALILTNRQPVLSLQALIDTPVVLVVGEPDRNAVEDADTQAALTRPLEVADATRLCVFEVGSATLAIVAEAGTGRDRAEEFLSKLTGQLDLAEPFGRIEEALREAQQAA